MSKIFAKRILLLGWMLLLTSGQGRASTNRFSFDEFLLMPVRLHLLGAKDFPAIQTTLTETDITRIWKKVNQVWSQAGLHFYIESLVEEEADPRPFDTLRRDPGNSAALLGLRPEKSRATNLFHVYYLNEMTG